MEIVFFDLEFNQCKPDEKVPKEDFLSNEIIQISLIKTDLFLNPVRTFTSYIKMEKSNRLNSHVSKLIGMTVKDLQEKGKDLNWVIEYLKETKFFDNVKYLIAWGDSDMKILSDNCIKKNIPCSFLKDIIYIDAQKIYSNLHNISLKVSLIKACGDLSFYTHHNALHDVCRLIEVCKKEGITNIITEGDKISCSPSKNGGKSKSANKIFKGYRYGVLNKFLCDCGSKAKVFAERNVYGTNDGLEKIYVVKCADCNKKYFARTTIIKNLDKQENSSEIKECSNEYFFEKLNDILSSGDFKI